MQERYFIAINPPADISKKIESIQKKLLAGHLVMKPFQPHITLIPPNVLDRLPPVAIIPQVKETADRYLPFDIKLDHTATFENRVYYIEIKSRELIKLQKELFDLIPDKYKKDKIIRDFKPHITLAQAKPKQDLDSRLIIDLETAITPLLPYEFSAKNISKFKWLKPRTYEDKEL